MNGWDDLIGRLTRRLEVDEELRLDVARELHGHLEDSASEFRAAGQSDAEAAASAAKALGDEEELAEELWQANRGRIRLRGVLRWTARATLLPAAVAIVLLLFTYLVGINGFYRAFGGGSWIGRTPGWAMGPLGKLVCDPYVGVHLTEDQRWLRFGDPNARGTVAVAKSISDRWPENPVYYANYMAQVLNQDWGVWSGGRGTARAVDERRLGEVLAVLRHGEQVDPSNGMYNAMIACVLINSSTIVREDPSATYDSFDERKASTAVRQVEVVDADRFAEGLDEFHKALAKPLMTARTVEMLRLRQGILPAPVRLVQYLERVAVSISTEAPPIGGFRPMSESLLGYSRVLARQGRHEQAEQLQQEVAQFAAKVGAQADTLVGLLVAHSIYVNALAYEEVINREHGRTGRGDQAREMRKAESDLLHRIVAGRRSFHDREKLGQLGFLEGMTGAGNLPGSKLELTPVRVAELFVFAEVGLLVLLAFLLLVAAVEGARALPGLVFAPKVERPVLLFVGWRRLGRILLLGVAVPVALYGGYSVAAAMATPGVGLVGVWDRMVAELAIVSGVIVVLLVRLSGTAIRQRAAELGMEVPARPQCVTPWRAAILGIPAVGLLGYVVYWWVSWHRTGLVNGYVLVLLGAGAAVAVGGLLIGRLVWRWCRQAGSRAGAAGSPPVRYVPRLLRVVWRVAVAAAVTATIIWVEGWMWNASVLRDSPSKHESLLTILVSTAIAVALFIAGWLVCWVLSPKVARETGSEGERRFRQTLRRSLAPVLAAAVIVVGVALGGLLTVGEGYAISRMGNAIPFIGELTQSDFRLLQEHFVEMDKTFQAREAAPDSSAAR